MLSHQGESSTLCILFVTKHGEIMRKYCWILLICISQISLAVEINIPAAKDNTLFESNTGSLSNGAGEYFFVGRTRQGTADDQRRALLQFDIAGNIPGGATINSVTLTITMSRSRGGTQTVNVNRMTSDWGEGTSDSAGPEGGGGTAVTSDATWIHAFFDTQLWNTPGGDFDPVTLANASVTALGAHMFNSPDLTMQVQTWLDNPASNFGIILLGDEATFGSAQRFNSRENASGAPQLTVDYTPPPDLIFVNGFE